MIYIYIYIIIYIHIVWHDFIRSYSIALMAAGVQQSQGHNAGEPVPCTLRPWNISFDPVASCNWEWDANITQNMALIRKVAMGQDSRLVSTARSPENGRMGLHDVHPLGKSCALSLGMSWPIPTLPLDSLDHDGLVPGLEDSNPSPHGHERHSLRHGHGFFRRIWVETQVFMMCSGRNQMLRNVQALLEFLATISKTRKWET